MAIKDAQWDYLLDHADVTPSGKYFIKFHTDNRATYEKHVAARWKHNYHRNDPYLMEATASVIHTQHIGEKDKKRNQRRTEKDIRIAGVQKELKRVGRYNRWRCRWNRLLALFGYL